jgi:hypothetical protein
VDVAAWCGRCGGSFPLVEVIADPGAMGRCPRCSEPLGEGYAATVVPAIRRLLDAAQTLRDAATELTATAPSLHIDGPAVAAQISEAVGRGKR